MDVQVEVTGDGRMSLPAVLRRRWQRSVVLVMDRGFYALLRPVPEDVITALSSAHAGPGPTVEQARAAERAGDHQTSTRRRPSG